MDNIYWYCGVGEVGRRMLQGDKLGSVISQSVLCEIKRRQASLEEHVIRGGTSGLTAGVGIWALVRLIIALQIKARLDCLILEALHSYILHDENTFSQSYRRHKVHICQSFGAILRGRMPQLCPRFALQCIHDNLTAEALAAQTLWHAVSSLLYSYCLSPTSHNLEPRT